MITPGLVSISFRAHEPEAIAAACAASGLRSVEWGGDVHVPPGDLRKAAAVARLTAAHGLEVAAYGSYYRAGQSATEGPAFAAVLETAVALGAPIIRVWAGRTGSVVCTDESRRRIVTDLAACAEAAHKQGRLVALEFHAETLNDEVGQTVRLMREINHPALRTYWQPRHGEAGDAALAGLRLVAPWLSHVHVFHWWPTQGDRRPLAEGRERWGVFLAEAARAPGPRHVLLEFMPRDRLDELPAEAAALREVLATVCE